MNTVLNTTQNVIDICTKSTYLQRTGNLNCFYVYIHYIDKTPFYIGQGSHNRAYKSGGRSKKWGVKTRGKKVVVKIIRSELSFRESLELEKYLIKRYKETLINESYGHSPNESFAVLCFSKKGKLIKRYNKVGDIAEDGFTPNVVALVCNKNQGRYTHKALIWCYEKDYESIKHNLFILAPNCSKSVEITFPDGTIKIYQTLSETKVDGFLPAKVGAVLAGKRKSHKNCSYRYVE